MIERRATEILDEWRALERRLASDELDEQERRALAGRVAELRADYRRISHPDDDGEAPLPPRDAGDSSAQRSVTGT